MTDELSEKHIHVKIKDLQQTIFEGPATSLTSVNQYGIFDVLPYHENFISIIQGKLIVHLDNEDKKELAIENGILQVYSNTVEVFLGVESIK